MRRIPAIRIESGDGSSGVAILEAYNTVRRVFMTAWPWLASRRCTTS